MGAVPDPSQARVMGLDDIAPFVAAPGVLISVPQLDDPNFERSVVAMVVHNAEGALGLVVNHPIDHACTEVAERFGLTWPGDPDAVLLKGGPVDENGLWMLHDPEQSFDDTIVANEFVATSRSREALHVLCEEPRGPLLLGVGCAGWGPGQLEGEIAAGAWVCGPLTRELVFEWPRDEVWDRALRALGIDPAMLVSGPGIQ